MCGRIWVEVLLANQLGHSAASDSHQSGINFATLIAFTHNIHGHVAHSKIQSILKAETGFLTTDTFDTALQP